MANIESGAVRTQAGEATTFQPRLFDTTVRSEAPSEEGSMGGLIYAGLSYLSFLLSFGYFVFFVSDLFVPKGVSDGPQFGTAAAVAINVALIVLWALQHSVMARKSFKERWTKVIPKSLERSTYVLTSSIALTIFMAGWVPVAGTVWEVQSAFARTVIGSAATFFWVFLLAGSFEIDHFELFGLKQPYYAYRGKKMPPHVFQAKFIYRIVRHPIQTGIFFGMWLAPTMTASRFLCASLMTLYIMVGLYFEERDLIRQFGARYVQYRKEVAKLIPFLKGWS